MSSKKDTYWHNTARIGILNRMKPNLILKLVKELFPKSEINGRHISAYKRRLIKEGIKQKTSELSQKEVSQFARKNLESDDLFVYNCKFAIIEQEINNQKKNLNEDTERWLKHI